MRSIPLALLLGLILSGCAAPLEDLEESKLLAPSDIAADSQGTVYGRVFADYGGPIAGARISVLGTVVYGQTDEEGDFELPFVPAGTHKLRVEAERFVPDERHLSVEPSIPAKVEIVLALASQSGDARPHLHDFWGSDASVTIADVTTYWNNEYNNDLMIRFFTEANPIHGTHRLNNNQSATDSDYRIRIPFLPEAEGNRVPLIYPGTSHVDITVDWNGQLTKVERIGVGALAPEADLEDAIFLPPIENGGTASLKIPPEWTDSGHQQWSRWFFFLYNPNALSEDDWSAQFSYDDAFHSVIAVHKGEVPYEPPHREYWSNGPILHYEIDDFQNVKNTNAVDWRQPNSGHLFLHRSEMVAPGTTKMVVNFTWDYTNRIDDGDAATDLPHTLTFRMADQNPYDTSLAEYRSFPSVECGERCRVYTFDLETEWTDQYYQTRSAWAFLATIEGFEDERNFSPDPNGEKMFHLDITLFGPEV